MNVTEPFTSRSINTFNVIDVSYIIGLKSFVAPGAVVYVLSKTQF